MVVYHVTKPSGNRVFATFNPLLASQGKEGCKACATSRKKCQMNDWITLQTRYHSRFVIRVGHETTNFDFQNTLFLKMCPIFVGSKVLLTSHCRSQNFHPSLLRLVDRLYTVIHKTQKTRMKVLPSARTGEWYFINNFGLDYIAH